MASGGGDREGWRRRGERWRRKKRGKGHLKGPGAKLRGRNVQEIKTTNAIRWPQEEGKEGSWRKTERRKRKVSLRNTQKAQNMGREANGNKCPGSCLALYTFPNDM